MKFLVLLALVGFAAAQIQIQVPIQRPQPPQQQPQWPAFPQQPPVQPRASWRDGLPDSRCPVPDNHDGIPVFLPGNAQWNFFICWGGIACKFLLIFIFFFYDLKNFYSFDFPGPFNCPVGTTWWAAEQTCAFPAQIQQRIRPFSEDEEAQE